MTDAQRLAYLEKLTERVAIGECSIEDYRAAAQEIFGVPKKPLDNSSDLN